MGGGEGGEGWRAGESELLLGLPHTTSNLLLEFWVVVPPLLGRVHVGRALVVGVGEHGDDGDEDGLHCVDRQPPLTRLLVPVSVIACPQATTKLCYGLWL